MEPAKNSVPTFEEAFHQLEETVSRLEAGGLTIEEMVARFEEGMKLVRLCYERLDAAESRVRVVLLNEESTTRMEGTDQQQPA